MPSPQLGKIDTLRLANALTCRCSPARQACDLAEEPEDRLRPIFEGDDELSKYWVIDAVLANAPDELVEEFTPLLVRIADHPTPPERTEELDKVAAAALGRGRD